MEKQTERPFVKDPLFLFAEVYRPLMTLNTRVFFDKYLNGSWEFPADYEPLPWAYVMSDCARTVFRLLQLDGHEVPPEEEAAVELGVTPAKTMCPGDVIVFRYNGFKRTVLCTSDGWEVL